MSFKQPTDYKVRFPLWQFLTQRVFDPAHPLYLNPHRFWAYYRLQHLERCWTRTFRPEEHHRNG